MSRSHPTDAELERSISRGRMLSACAMALVLVLVIAGILLAMRADPGPSVVDIDGVTCVSSPDDLDCDWDG